MKRSNQKGAAAVELAILLIPLLLIVFGITEFGRAFFQYNAIVKGTRDGVRFLTMRGVLNPADPTTAAAIAQARCMVVFGNPNCIGSTRVPNLTTAQVTLCDSASCPVTHSAQPTDSGVVNLVTVTVTGFVFTPLVPLVLPGMLTVMPRMVTFGDISTTMRQVL